MYKIKLSGVYLISHKNGYYYLGQSVNIFDRWSNHYTNLRKNNHHSKDFQKLWNESNIEDWKWEIIEYVSKDYIKQRSKLKGKELEKAIRFCLLELEKKKMKEYSINFSLNGNKKYFS